MFKITQIFVTFLIIIIINSCSNNKENIANLSKNDDPIIIYELAIKDLNEKKYDEATIKFENLIMFYPLSNEGIQSRIMLGFIDYSSMEYDLAIYRFEKVIKLYPSHKNIDYAYYMKAMCYYEQIENENLDGQYNKKSIESFNELINRFPNSEYSKDSFQKIIAANENIAAKHMNVGLFYLKNKKYLASIKRYNIVLKNHSKSKFAPEALYRLVEIYYILGLEEDAYKTAAVIGHNYPTSKWYKYSYDILNKNKADKNFSLKKKIISLFKNEKN